MAEGDQEVFEITDFTNASDLEKFSSRIEELIHEWNIAGPRNYIPLEKDDFVNKDWEVKGEALSYANFPLEVMLHKIKEDDHKENIIDEDSNRGNAGHDMMSHQNDFPHKAHCLSRWYGLREFIVIVPMDQHTEISTEDRTRLLLSSLNLAICATKCEVPIFVLVLQPFLKQYLGVSITEHYSTEYSISVLPNPPSDCENLQGLLSIFKSKLGWPYVKLPKVVIAARFTYVIQNQSFENWVQLPPEVDPHSVIEFSKLKTIPFGALEDPIRDLYLFVTWPKIFDGEMTETDNISNFLPLLAPKWSLKVKAKDEFAKSMNEFLQSFMNLKQFSSEPMLANNYLVEEEEEGLQYNKTLDRLAQPAIPTLFTHKKPQAQRYFADHQIIKLLQFVFPDTCEEQEDSLEDLWHDCYDFADSSSHPLYSYLLNIKSAPRGSLTYRIALALAHVNFRGEGLIAVTHLWHEILKELRHRLDHNLILPNLTPGRPILTTCLLHQKLQMLNYCINIKKKREWKCVPDYEMEDDIFFDCNESPRKSKDSQSDSDISENNDKNTDSNIKREGILEKFENFLLLGSEEPIYIPQTQDPPPMTEDMLEEQSNILMNLGSNSTGAALRARLQSSSLLSDMESFKAANPSARLEDFVRWYSPRDWCETTQKDSQDSTQVTGELSQRMLIPGNIWQETWETARAVPAHRQKRLFDDTKEAEKVLNYFATIDSIQLVDGIMPLLILASLSYLVDLVNESCKGLAAKKLEQLCIKAAKISTSPKPRYQEIIVEMGQLEAYISQAKALFSKFQKSNMTLQEETYIWDFTLRLLDNQEVELENQSKGIIGQQVAKLFATPQNDSDEDATMDSVENLIFPPPAGREFIMRCTIPPYACNTLAPIPNRLHCIYSNNNFRLVGAFSKDTIHF